MPGQPFELYGDRLDLDVLWRHTDVAPTNQPHGPARRGKGGKIKRW